MGRAGTRQNPARKSGPLAFLYKGCRNVQQKKQTPRNPAVLGCLGCMGVASLPPAAPAAPLPALTQPPAPCVSRPSPAVPLLLLHPTKETKKRHFGLRICTSLFAAARAGRMGTRPVPSCRPGDALRAAPRTHLSLCPGAQSLRPVQKTQLETEKKIYNNHRILLSNSARHTNSSAYSSNVLGMGKLRHALRAPAIPFLGSG